MNDIEAINALVNAGTSVIFLWLYWQERKRSQELSESRMQIVTDCMNRLQKCYSENSDEDQSAANATR